MSRAAGVCIQFILGASYMRTIRLMLMISPLKPRRKWFKHHLCTLIYLVTAPPLPAANERELMSPDDTRPFCARWWQSRGPSKCGLQFKSNVRVPAEEQATMSLFGAAVTATNTGRDEYPASRGAPQAAGSRTWVPVSSKAPINLHCPFYHWAAVPVF